MDNTWVVFAVVCIPVYAYWIAKGIEPTVKNCVILNLVAAVVVSLASIGKLRRELEETRDVLSIVSDRDGLTELFSEPE